MVTAQPKPKPALETAAVIPPADPIVINLPKGFLTDDLLIEIAVLNEPLRFERSPEGALEISPPPGTLSGSRGFRIATQIESWSLDGGGGWVLGAGSGFSLPNHAARDADASWVSDERLVDIQTDDEGLWLVCPDLVVEVRSRGQQVSRQQEKMQEWMAAGARLGWLIDPFTGDGEAWIYREGSESPQRLVRPDSLNGEDVAEGLSVSLSRVWRSSD